jgi:hypothetical protein
VANTVKVCNTRAGKIALTTVALTSLFGLSGTAAVASTAHAKGSSGSFALTGAIAGTLKVPTKPSAKGHTSCLISASQHNTEWITWYAVKLSVFGKHKTLSSVKINIGASEFGVTDTLNFKAVNVPVGSVGLSIGTPHPWIGNSGTLTTTAGGSSGSVSGTMILPLTDKHQPGTVAIVGSWAGCSLQPTFG